MTKPNLKAQQKTKGRRSGAGSQARRHPKKKDLKGASKDMAEDSMSEKEVWRSWPRPKRKTLPDKKG